MKMIYRIGIDIDTRDISEINIVRYYSMRYGTIYEDYPTKNGQHLRIKLNEPCSFIESCKLRHKIGDDPNRILFDIFRYAKGQDMRLIDVLFKEKKIISIQDLR